MFLSLLKKIGRKKTVLDRGLSHSNFKDAKPWMNRYYLIFRNRPKWFPFNILIHEMLDNDHGVGVHNHLCPYITIIIKDGYWETTKKGKFNSKLKVNYDTFINFQGKPNLNYFPVLTGQQYIQTAKELFDPVAFPYASQIQYFRTGLADVRGRSGPFGAFGAFGVLRVPGAVPGFYDCD